jgi:hypothetical protein
VSEAACERVRSALAARSARLPADPLVHGALAVRAGRRAQAEGERHVRRLRRLLQARDAPGVVARRRAVAEAVVVHLLSAPAQRRRGHRHAAAAAAVVAQAPERVSAGHVARGGGGRAVGQLCPRRAGRAAQQQQWQQRVRHRVAWRGAAAAPPSGRTLGEHALLMGCPRLLAAPSREPQHSCSRVLLHRQRATAGRSAARVRFCIRQAGLAWLCAASTVQLLRQRTLRCHAARARAACGCRSKPALRGQRARQPRRAAARGRARGAHAARRCARHARLAGSCRTRRRALPCAACAGSNRHGVFCAASARDGCGGDGPAARRLLRPAPLLPRQHALAAAGVCLRGAHGHGCARAWRRLCGMRACASLRAIR